MRRLLREPLTLALVALCVAWTLVADYSGWTYLEAGALTGARLWQGEYWRLLSAMFLHHMGSWIHLVANGVSLFFVGRVIERGCGRPVLLACLFGSALLGFAASLVATPDPQLARMGISGGIAGLLGLLLAVEWAVTKSLREFLRQRNVLLIAIFLALSFPLAMLVESHVEQLRVDHAGHAGGFAFGLLAGLAYYTRRGRRLAMGAAVAASLAILPVAYAAHPFLDARYQVWRAHRAYRANDLEGAKRAYDRARRLDPAALDVGGAREELVDTCLRLAAPQLAGPEGAKLVDAALALRGRDPKPWLRFAEAAEVREQWKEAYVAWREAASLLQPSAAWMPLGRALRLLSRSQDPPLAELIDVARRAARGFSAGLPAEARDSLEAELAAAASVAGRKALAGPPGKEVAKSLAELYRSLAENAGQDARRPRYRLSSAEWLWRAADGPLVPPEVEAAFRAALTEAALYGDAHAKDGATRWFLARGIPVPEPDLEGEKEGG